MSDKATTVTLVVDVKPCRLCGEGLIRPPYLCRYCREAGKNPAHSVPGGAREPGTETGPDCPVPEKTKGPDELSGPSESCEEGDSNPHSFTH